MNQRIRSLSLTCVFTFAILATASDHTVAFAGHKHQHSKKADRGSASHKRNSALKKSRHSAATARHKSTSSISAPAAEPSAASLSPELAAVRQAIDLAASPRSAKQPPYSKRSAIRRIRNSSNGSFSVTPTVNASSAATRLHRRQPGLAEHALMRRRARRACGRSKAMPRRCSVLSTANRPAPRAVCDGAGPACRGRPRWRPTRVRTAWRSDELSERQRRRRSKCSMTLLTREDHRARMDKRIGAKDLSGAMRAARRLGSDDLSIVKACAAVMANSTKSLDLLDAVATEARQDLGYVLCRIHWMTRHDRIEDATRLMLSAASEHGASGYGRMVARTANSRPKAARSGQFETAYQVVRDAAVPANENYRAEYHFVPGWIALRYLNDASDRAEAFCTYRRRIDQSDRACAGKLLARTRRRGCRRRRRDARRL